MEETNSRSTGEATRNSSGPLMALVRWIDSFNDFVGRSVSWLTALMVIITFADVMMRYVFNTSFVFVQELEWHLFAIIFLTAAGYTHLKGGHVRVDIFYARLSPRKRGWVDFVSTLLFLFPTCLLMIKTSLPFVDRSWAVLEGSPDPGGLPARFLLKAAIPVGFFLIGLQGISQTIKNGMFLFQKERSRTGESQ